MLIEGQWWREGFGTGRTYACDPAIGRPPTPLVRVFVPKEESTADECGELIHWREL